MKWFRGYFKVLLVSVLSLGGRENLEASNDMMISSATVGAGETFSLQVKINNANQFVAFQFDLPIPTGFSYISQSAVFDSARINGHLLVSQVIAGGNVLRIMAYSQSNFPFVGDTGTIISFKLKSGTLPGTYPLLLQFPVIADTSGINILTGSTNGSVSLMSPDILITESLLNFDRTPLGSSTTRTFSIQNTGNLPLNINTISFNSPYFEVVGNVGFVINSGQTYMVTIRFNSLDKGVYQNVMTINSNDPDEPILYVDLLARAFAVNELHTGNLPVFSGQMGTLRFSVNNMEPFAGFQFDLALPLPMTFITGSENLSARKTNHIVSASVISGNRLRVVAYSPDRQIFSGDNGEVLSLTFMIVGTGGLYPLQISNVIIGDTLAGNCLSDSYDGTLEIAAPDISCATSLPFGNTSILESRQLDLVVNNTGNDTLKIHQISFTNPSYSLLSSLPCVILPFQSKTLQINFHQTFKGPSNGIMRIFSNDPEPFENPLSVNMTALVYVPNYCIIPDLTAYNLIAVDVPVKVNNLEPFVGFQFDLNFPTCLTYIPNSVHLSSRAQEHIVKADTVSSTKVRVFGYSLQQNPFNGDTGTVVTLRFAINVTSGTPANFSLTLSNVILGNDQSQNIIYGIDNGVLTVMAPTIPIQLSVTNVTIASGASSCYEATQTITVAGNGTTFLVQDGGHAVFTAGQTICFLPGTTVIAGGTMNAFITTTSEYCSSMFNPIKPPNDREIPIPETYVSTDFCRIFPNPANDVVTIEITDNLCFCMINIQIYSMIGKEILSKLLPIEKHLNFSLSGLKEGMYLIRIVRGNQVYTKKIGKI